MVDIACGHRHMLAVTEGKKLYTWGQVGEGLDGMWTLDCISAHSNGESTLLSPSKRYLYSSCSSMKVASPFHPLSSACGWPPRGCWATMTSWQRWISCRWLQVGVPSIKQAALFVVVAAGLSNVDSKSEWFYPREPSTPLPGTDFSAALDDQGQLWTWGVGSSGCLGHGNTNELKSPRMVKVCVLSLIGSVSRRRIATLLHSSLQCCVDLLKKPQPLGLWLGREVRLSSLYHGLQDTRRRSHRSVKNNSQEVYILTHFGQHASSSTFPCIYFPAA